MYIMKKSNIIYRDFGTFGYITDNRNFGYKLLNDNRDFIGDKIVSQSRSVFLSVLDRKPLSIDELVEKICSYFIGVDKDIIKNDTLDFFKELEADGFIVVGENPEECYKKDTRFSYKDCVKMKQSAKVEKIEQSDNSTQEFMDNYFGNKPQLTNLHIEIISKCNERCVHCYIPNEFKTEAMSTEMFYDILEQARDMNLLHLTISGGEPMAHTDFINFLKKCNDYNFSVNILSNLTLLNEEILEELKRNALISVQTSVYSMKPEIHDGITKEKGSLDKTIASIHKLIDNDIPLQISCPIMQQNKNSYKEVVDWGKEHNINVSSDFVIIGQYNHANENLNCRLSIDEVRQFIGYKMKMDSQYVKLVEKEMNKKKNMSPDDYICSVCHSSICISESGNVYPCAGWQDYILGNIHKSKLKDIWNDSEKVNYLRNLRRRDFPECLKCLQQEFCTMCMVRNANEDSKGNPLKVNPYFCEIARISKELYMMEI